MRPGTAVWGQWRAESRRKPGTLESQDFNLQRQWTSTKIRNLQAITAETSNTFNNSRDLFSNWWISEYCIILLDLSWPDLFAYNFWSLSLYPQTPCCSGGSGSGSNSMWEAWTSLQEAISALVGWFTSYRGMDSVLAEIVKLFFEPQAKWLN